MAVFRSSIIAGADRHLEVLKLGSYDLALYTKKNPERPSQNEDCMGFAVLPNGTLIVMVADGVGGSPKGAEASRGVLTSIERQLRKLPEGDFSEDHVRNAVLNGIEKANVDLLNAAIGSRSTVTVCVVKGSVARSYQVGDSELLICGQKGRIKYQTGSHSPVGYAVQAGLMDAQTALAHPDRHFISNVVGEAAMHIEMGPKIELAARDTILVGSDGLYDNFTHQDLTNFVRIGRIEDVLDKLVNKLEQRLRAVDSPSPEIKFDDVTFMAMRLAT
jgi:serine/threonine protein phosphatase PrpC